MPKPILSTVIPFFNEAASVASIIERARAIPIRKEIIAVDDGSSDKTRNILVRLYEHGIIDQLVLHDQTYGMATALRSGIRCAAGKVIALQDTDVEYEPHELYRLMLPILKGQVDVVFGRCSPSPPQRVVRSWQPECSRMPTVVSNLLSSANTHRKETGCKLVRANLLQNLTLSLEGVALESELMARLAWSGARIQEVPFVFSERVPVAEKKSNWKDRMTTLWHTLRWNLPASPATPLQPLAVQPSARQADLLPSQTRLVA